MRKTGKLAIIALAISFVFIACNNQEKKAEPSSTDTTQATTTTTDTTKSQQQNTNMDAAKVAPALYKVAKDSMGIRVLTIEYKPGDSSAMHSHPDAALYIIDGGKSEFTDKDGSKRTVDFKSGTGMILGSTTHSVKNVGKTTVKAILVEVNRPNTDAGKRDSLDATKVASKFYKVIKDSLNIRLVMVDYKPGATSKMHSHPDLAMYALAPAKAEFTTKDGTKRVMTVDKGMVAIIPADTHSVKNVGNTDVKVVLVEVNRPEK